MNHIAIIPARGRSKRIPCKNILSFRGRPMIGWTIEAALNSDLYDLVIVSTDDENIAAIARAEGAEVPFLRTTNADDHSPVSAAVLVALKQAETHFGKTFETVTQLMPNCPLRGVAEIRDAWTHFHEGAHQFQISASNYGWTNPWWAARITESGQPEWLFPEANLVRSQDLERLYCPTGAIWIATATGLHEHGTFYGPDFVLWPMPWQAAIDIDDWHDFHLAKVLAIVNQKTNAIGDATSCL